MADNSKLFHLLHFSAIVFALNAKRNNTQKNMKKIATKNPIKESGCRDCSRSFFLHWGI